ncbi:MAG TPA: type II CAAX endopeptidase family protein [Herpetosiphonaceae bacterium]|nr:type II CAAX endopeptidase family protein [Herpetosiphonaceae bacterium]
MSQSTAIPHRTPHLPLLFWGYLGIIAFAELVTSALDSRAGLAVHALVLVVVLAHGGTAGDDQAGKLALALALAPLIRILSLSLPLAQFPRLAWYPLVTAPLLIATVMLARQMHLTRAVFGLRPGDIPLQLMLGGSGFGLGVVAYLIFKPDPLLTVFSWDAFLLQTANLLIFTGLVEEAIFRGLLQSLALPVLGCRGILYVSLLFAALHIGHGSAVGIMFVFGVSLMFAYLVLWSGSILGVALAHGVMNVTLFLVIPFHIQSADPGGKAFAVATVAGGAALAGIAATILFRRAARDRRRAATPAGAP